MVEYLGKGWLSSTELRAHICAYHELESDSTPTESHRSTLEVLHGRN
jgi:hypothetical protein